MPAFQFHPRLKHVYKTYLLDLLLALLSLGLYFPYLRHRLLQYLYGTLRLGGAPLEFRASGWPLFQGYTLLAAGLVLGLNAAYFLPGWAFVGLLAVGAPLLLLWAVHTALQYRANSLYLAGMRLGYTGRFWVLFQLYGTGWLASVLSLGLLLPWALWRIRRYLIGNLWVGAYRLQFSGELYTYYALCALGAALLLLYAGLLYTSTGVFDWNDLQTADPVGALAQTAGGMDAARAGRWLLYLAPPMGILALWNTLVLRFTLNHIQVEDALHQSPRAQLAAKLPLAAYTLARFLELVSVPLTLGLGYLLFWSWKYRLLYNHMALLPSTGAPSRGAQPSLHELLPPTAARGPNLPQIELGL